MLVKQAADSEGELLRVKADLQSMDAYFRLLRGRRRVHTHLINGFQDAYTQRRQQMERRRKTPVHDQLRKYGCKILRSLCESQTDVTLFYMTDERKEYNEVVRDNLTLADVEQLLEDGLYATADSFGEDMFTVFVNVWEFYPYHSPHHVRAKQLCLVFLDRVARLPEALRCSRSLIKRWKRSAQAPGVQCTGFMYARDHHMLLNSSSIPPAVCKRLGRRCGAPPEHWPENWIKHAMQFY